MHAVSRFLSHSILLILFIASAAFAQFTASIQGSVQDPSAAGVGKASIQLVNVATGVTAVTTSDASGNYSFLSVAPGQYKLTVEAAGFAESEANVTLLTAQNLNVPITLKVGAGSWMLPILALAPRMMRWPILRR